MKELNRNRLFFGCFMALVATAFGFAVRGAILKTWGMQFSLSEEQKGIIQGVGLYPFAISIILVSLIVDKIGYGTAMVLAFLGHVISTIVTLSANSFEMLYVGTFIFALANGAVEAVVNPVVATMYDKDKTRWLNALHAGWPGGLVLGGLLAIAMTASGSALSGLPGKLWQWQMALVLLPTVAYGIVLFGQKFPIQERVAAGVSYFDMLTEFGWGSCFVVSFFLIGGINQILVVAGVPTMAMWMQAAIAIIPAVLFGAYVKKFGRPMFVFMLLIMILLATTELGTDSWISDIMQGVLNSETKGVLFLVYTSTIMFILRFFAGPIVHKLSPLGLLALCAAVASAGLLWLANAGAAVGILLMAATLYGFGKTFFWPTTLGVVAEQYPRGGALMLNAMGGMGMIAVGVLGSPLIGTVQDISLNSMLKEKYPAIQASIMKEEPGLFGMKTVVDQSKLTALPEAEQKQVKEITAESNQGALAKIAILPAAMCVCYLILLAYFKSKGGYEAQVLTGHAAHDAEYTGGTEGPGEG
ncbi:MAG TPA: MFS transporter [Pirellulales bacterium]